MSVNLLDLVQGQLTGPLKSQLSSLLGAGEDETNKAIDAAAPSLLAGLMKQGSTGAGANALAGTLDKFDGGLLDNLGSLFGGGKEGGLMDMGSGLLKGLFGGSLGSITDLLGKATSLGGGKLGSLLKMLAPVVFGVLAKQKSLLGLGAAGLGKLLMGQAGFLKDKLPAGLSDSLGINGLMNPSPEPVAAQSSGGGLLGKLVPLALVATLGYFAYTNWFAKADEASAASSDAGQVTGQLEGLFGKLNGSLDTVSDEASAKAILPELEAASTTLNGLASSVDTMPAAAQGPIAGLIEKFLPALKEKASGLMNLAGVKSVLEPILGPMLKKLGGLAG